MSDKKVAFDCFFRKLMSEARPHKAVCPELRTNLNRAQGSAAIWVSTHSIVSVRRNSVKITRGIGDLLKNLRAPVFSALYRIFSWPSFSRFPYETNCTSKDIGKITGKWITLSYRYLHLKNTRPDQQGFRLGRGKATTVHALPHVALPYVRLTEAIYLIHLE